MQETRPQPPNGWRDVDYRLPKKGDNYVFVSRSWNPRINGGRGGYEDLVSIAQARDDHHCVRHRIVEFDPCAVAVRSKRNFTERYAKGEFGNASPTWQTLDEFESYAFPSFGEVKEGFYHLRNRVKGGKTYYNLTSMLTARAWRNETAQQRGDQWYVSEMAPTDCTILQGEVMQREDGIYLYYSQVVAPMREALATKANHASGIIAVSLLRGHLCPNSYEWLNVLLERYPDHVVEFSTYSRKWGTLPNFNTIFWEVRLY